MNTFKSDAQNIFSRINTQRLRTAIEVSVIVALVNVDSARARLLVALGFTLFLTAVDFRLSRDISPSIARAVSFFGASLAVLTLAAVALINAARLIS